MTPARRRELEAEVERTAARVNRLVADRRREQAEPLVDQAIATGALPFEDREDALRRFEFSPELAKSDLDRREPDPHQAAHNRAAADPDRDLAEREAIAREYNLDVEDVV